MYFALVAFLIFGWTTKLAAQIQADFTATITNGCAPLTVQFNDLSSGSGITQRIWNFGNGNQSSANQTTVNTVYTNPGTYTVTLIAVSANGNDTTVKTNYIQVFSKPIVSFSVGNNSGCTPHTASFTDLTQSSIPIQQYVWDFGNGTTSSLQNPSCTYLNAGNFSISLQVTDTNGCVGVATTANAVSTVLGPTINFTPSDSEFCAIPTTVTFNNQTQNATTYNWSFGNGQTSTQANPSVTYSNYGTYNPQLIASNGQCADTVTFNSILVHQLNANFSFSKDSICVGETVSVSNTTQYATTFLWNFNGGIGVPTVKNPTITFNSPGLKQVTLVTQLGSCSDTITKTIFVRDVVADFTTTPNYSCQLPQTVLYQLVGTNIVSKQWNLGYGAPFTSTASSVNIACGTQGTFSDTLTVTDNFGCTKQIIKPNNLILFEPNVLWEPDVIDGCAPLTVNFTDLTQPQDSIVAWHWDFDNGDSSIVQNPTYTFVDTGAYFVTLTVYTDSGCTKTYSEFIRVGSKQTANFTIDTNMICAGDSLQLINLSSDTNLIGTYNWDFGSTDFEPDWPFIDTGFTSIALEVDFNGCKDTLELEDTLYVLGATMYPTLSIDCTNGDEVAFNGDFIDYDSFLWQFGDGTVDSTSYAGTHNYPQSGIYTVTVSVTNDSTSCTYTKSIDIEIIEIEAVINTSDTLGCAPYDVSALAINSVNEQSYAWDLGQGFGSLSPDYDVSFTLPTKGSYNLGLVIQGVNGCYDTVYQTIKVYNPIPDFSVDTNEGCAPFLATFYDQTQHDTTIVNYQWDYGFGLVSGGPQPSFNYTNLGPNNNGKFTVSLIVTNAVGCTKAISKSNYMQVHLPQADFTYDTAFCKGDTVQFTLSNYEPTYTYFWDFNNGLYSTAPNPSTQYFLGGTYTPSVLATDTFGCTATTFANPPIEIHSFDSIQLIPSLTDTSCYPALVQFNGSAFAPYITNFYWNFGDDSNFVQTSSSSVQNLYTQPSSFGITIVGESFIGCTDTLFFSDFIHVDGPAGAFTISDDTVCVGDPIDFIKLNLPNSPSYEWDFGDGNSLASSAANSVVVHTYNQTGTMVATAIFSDSSGNCTIYQQDTLFVHEVLNSFTTDVKEGCVPLDVQFTNTATGATNFQYNFGDGLGSTQANPLHTFNQAGIFTVKNLAYNDSTGCSDTAQRIVTVRPLPAIQTTPDTTICEGDTIQLNASGGIAYNWYNTPNLSNDSISNPWAWTTQNQWFKVQVTNSFGCVNRDSLLVFIKLDPSYQILVGDTDLFIGEETSIAIVTNNDLDFSWAPWQVVPCTTCSENTIQPMLSTPISIQLSDNFGCFFLDTIINITVSEEYAIYLPNAFTPNGDGLNDILEIETFGLKDLQSLQIFNRWGEVVFESSEFTFGWDGNKNGKPVQPGVYSVKIIARTWGGTYIDYISTVTVVR